MRLWRWTTVSVSVTSPIWNKYLWESVIKMQAKWSRFAHRAAPFSASSLPFPILTSWRKRSNLRRPLFHVRLCLLSDIRTFPRAVDVGNRSPLIGKCMVATIAHQCPFLHQFLLHSFDLFTVCHWNRLPCRPGIGRRVSHGHRADCRLFGGAHLCECIGWKQIDFEDTSLYHCGKSLYFLHPQSHH